MTRGRLEAFSDGVIAILITIMVFDLKPPPGADWESLRTMAPGVLTYAMSFLYLGIYWNSHHHLFALVRVVNGAVLWANLHLLFWLSLIPFATNWLRASEFAALPTALYGGVLFLSATAFMLLLRLLIRVQGTDSRLREAVGRDWKGTCSMLLYIVGIGTSWIDPRLGLAAYTMVAALWLIPDSRLEARLKRDEAL